MIISRSKRALVSRLSHSASTPEGMRIYAIGDVHGRDDLLVELSELIGRDCATARGEVLTLLLGDYVDRGPNSAAVVERLAAGRFATPFQALRGNHETILLRFLADPSVLEFWRSYGGLETLHSYGVDVSAAMRGEGYEAARDAFSDALPDAHRAFFEATELSATFGDYFFCHAGVRPGTPLADQSEEDLLWIRDGFLSHERSFGKIVVHGHTPVASPEVRANRINIDTGAFATSTLTCLALEGEDRRFLSVSEPARPSRGPVTR
jgi:serine/threonine protein phosphatase 1